MSSLLAARVIIDLFLPLSERFAVVVDYIFIDSRN